MDDRLTMVAELLTYLREDGEACKAFALDPETFLKERGYPPQALETGHGEEALARARRALADARLGERETLASALPRLSSAARDVFGPDYRVQVEPFAISFLERARAVEGFRWTITGGIRCTFDGWDGCSIFLDW